MARSSTVNRLSDIAADQWGLVTRRQAQRSGIPRATLDRLTADGDLLERVARGIYRMRAAPKPDQLELRAAWLQLEPGIPVWERTPAQGVVSHRSAAALYGLGHLPADRHEFTVAARKQSRRPDVRLHHRQLDIGDVITLRGLFVTRPTRVAADLLLDNEDPEAVAHVIADAVRGGFDYPATFANALAPHAAKFDLRRGDGVALLHWLLELVGDQKALSWVEEARASFGRARDDRPPAIPATTGRRG